MTSATIRLTNYDRDSIVSAAIEKAFEARQADLAKAADALARRCYEAVFSAATRKAAKAMPEGWLRNDRCLRFNVGGLDVRLDTIDDGLPVPNEGRGYCHRLGSISDEALVSEVQAHLKAVEDLTDATRKARGSLKALVYSTKTLKALRELWPEGEPYFAGLMSKTGAPGLPAPQITKLNAMLGLAQAA